MSAIEFHKTLEKAAFSIQSGVVQISWKSHLQVSKYVVNLLLMSSQKSLPTVSDCDGCGVCCFHMGYPEYIRQSGNQPDEEHWTSLPDDLKEELIRYIASYRKPPAGELDGPCFWLDMETRRCRHHQHRPNVCRDFQVGSKDCRAWRDHYQDQINN